jgi:hypothetical protein
LTVAGNNKRLAETNKSVAELFVHNQPVPKERKMATRFFRIAVTCLFAVALFEVWFIGRAKRTEAAASFEHAQALGIPFAEYERMRLSLEKTGMSREDARSGVQHLYRVWTETKRP